MKFGVIRSLAGQHPVRKLCRTLGVARSAYYAAQKKEERPRAKENARLGTRARELFAATEGIYGSPRLTVALRRAGERCGRHRVARLMAQAGLRARQQAAFSSPHHRQSPSLPHRPQPFGGAPRAARAARLWCGRRTSPRWRHTRAGSTWRGSSTPVAARSWALAADDTMPTGLVARAFERAVAAHRPEPGLLHHSDRGSQYASDAYRELLRRHGVVASMSRAGSCYDNAKLESFWATMKTERDRRAGLRHAGGSQEQNLPLHRGLLQPTATPQRPRFLLSRGL